MILKMAMFLLSSAAINLLYPEYFRTHSLNILYNFSLYFFPLAWMCLSCNLIIQNFSVSTVFCFSVVFVADMGQCTRFHDLSHQLAAKAQASLHICAGSPELLLLAYTKCRYRWRLRPKFRPLALLDVSLWTFIRGISAYVISIKISEVDPVPFCLILIVKHLFKYLHLHNFFVVVLSKKMSYENKKQKSYPSPINPFLGWWSLSSIRMQ